MLAPKRVALERPFTSDGGHAFIARIPEEIQERIERGAEAYVTEDGIRLPSPNTNHEIIREAGGGTYSLWNRHAYFSALDSSNCQKNGRSYELVWVDWPRWYELTDQDAVSPTPQPLTRTLVNTYATRYAASPRLPLISEARTFSMLHEESLLLMHYFALRARGAILELGAYLGAGTVAMASALKATGRGRHITVELGGAYDHPEIPSSDIVSDLQGNIDRFGLRDVAHVVQGWTHDTAVVASVERLLDGSQVDLLVIDADGEVKKHFDIYERFLSDACMIILDDFIIATGPSKDLGVRDWIAQAADAGLVRDLGVHKWATWFGQYQRP
jgi:predicted O-methyltransferase YrrM